jgi:hypothetical protein
MSQFSFRGHINPLTTPTSPEEQVKLLMKLLEGVRGDLRQS